MKQRQLSTHTVIGLMLIALSACNQATSASLSERLDQSSSAATRSKGFADQANSATGPNGGTQLGDASRRCTGNNQVWGLTANSKTAWYAVKKQVLPVEGVIGNEGYIITGKDPSYEEFEFELLFDVEKLNSQNPLRDARIRSLFFADYAVSPFNLRSIAKEKTGEALPIVGDTDKVKFSGTVNIAGVELAITVPAYVTRTIDALHIVNSDEPTTIDVSTDSTIVSGVQSLLAVANLGPDDMEDLVSIKFDYTFRQACPI